MALRSIAADLVRLLDSATGPIYVLDEQRRILFINDACAAWVGCPTGELIGVESRYHSSGEVTGAAAIAAALAPPPEVWSGERATAIVTLEGPDGRPIARQVQFVPLGGDAFDVVGVIAIATHEVDADAQVAADGNDDAPAELHRQLAQWRRTLAQRYQLDRLLGDSPAMRRVRQQIELASSHTASVAIVGPPGSGRQHAARAIHYGTAAQSAGPLVPLACPLLDVSLLEPSLRALARTGGATDRPATLLLLDVDQLNSDAQDFLLRSSPSTSQFRIVATTSTPLSALAAAGGFNAELACALATLEIHIPSLAERLKDLPLLVQMFVEDQNRQGTKQIAGATTEALDQLAGYSWPANVAELAEVIAAAHAAAEGPRILPTDLPDKIHYALDAAVRPRKVDETIDLEDFLARIEEELIRRALNQAKGNKTKAAQLLGMTRPRLYRRLVQLGLAEEGEETSEKPF